MTEDHFVRKQGKEHFLYEEAANGLPLLKSPLLETVSGIRHCFTTREGGVSEGHLASLNLSFSRGDREEAVRENFRRLTEALGATPEQVVFTHQTHTDHIRIVTEQDAGKGLTKPRDYEDVDGLITNCPGLVLSCYVADCVPILLADPVRRAVGAVHSGWRGTVQRIGEKAVRLMQEQYGTDPKDLFCAIGPSICRDCYEVSKDVADRFCGEFGASAEEIVYPKEPAAGEVRGEPKFLVDLWAANRILLESAGIPKEQISCTDLCTSCNADRLFSHRASRGMRGNLGAFIMMV